MRTSRRHAKYNRKAERNTRATPRSSQWDGWPPPDYQAANAVAPEAPRIVNQVGKPVYERLRRQKPPRFNKTHDPVTAEEWIKRL